MTGVDFVALLLALAGPALLLAGMLRIPPTLALFGAGVASAFVPGLPQGHPPSEVFTTLFLPPIIYAASVRASVPLLRTTLLTGVLAGLALTLATVAAVAVLARLLLPGLGWTAALLLGAILAVFDTRLFHESKGRPHVPRALADALKSREMVSRAVAVALFGLLVEELGPTGPDLLPLAGKLVLGIAGGAALGAVLGMGMVWLRERSGPAPVEILVSVGTPYLGALGAGLLGLPTVVVVMAAALAVNAVRIEARTGAPRSSSEARITAVAFWEEASLLLSASLFFLTGRALPGAVTGLEGHAPARLALWAGALLLAVMAVQAAVSWLAARLPALRRAMDGTPAQGAGVSAWASTRSVVGLVLALSLPATLPDGQPFAARELLLVLATLVVVASVIVQGASLRWAVRKADLGDDREKQAEEAAAKQAMDAAWNRDGEAAGTANRFDAERRALLALRKENRIGDEVLRAMLREVDLRSRAAEGGTLPGAGPPNP